MSGRILICCFVILLAAAGFALVPAGHASAIGTNSFFGGEITRVTYCYCIYDFAVILSIDDLATHQTVNVKYSIWSSNLHANYNIWEPGPNVIGGHRPGYTACLVQSGYYCTTNSSAPTVIDGVIDWIRGIGTSLSG